MVQANQKTKVLVADQQPLYRQGICYALNQLADIEVCGEVGSGDDLLSSISSQYPNVVLLDVTLSSEGDSNLARVVKQLLPSIAIIILTPEPSDEELFQAIKSRASGYLQRDVSSDELLIAIRRSAAGEHPINDTFLAQPKVAEQVLQQFQDMSWGKGVESFVSPLTPRETEILSYMARGYFNKQIAVNLNISEQTIKNHITSILRKLDANARTEAVVTAIKRGIISLG